MLRWSVNNVSFLGPDEAPQRPDFAATANDTAPLPRGAEAAVSGGGPGEAHIAASFMLPLEASWALGKGWGAQGNASGGGDSVGAGNASAGSAGGALARAVAVATARAAVAGWVAVPEALTWGPQQGPPVPGSIQGNASRFVRTFDSKYGYQARPSTTPHSASILARSQANLGVSDSQQETKPQLHLIRSPIIIKDIESDHCTRQVFRLRTGQVVDVILQNAAALNGAILDGAQQIVLMGRASYSSSEAAAFGTEKPAVAHVG